MNPEPEPALSEVVDPPLYLDVCATTPLLEVAQQAMADAQRVAWANPSSLHGFGLAAGEVLERSRLQLAACLGTTAASVLFCSGATESVHLALLGAAAALPPGRLLISAVEHPAVAAAARQLEQQGWQLATIPVDPSGRVDLMALQQLLAPPTRLVSVIWAQSEIGTVQPIETIGQLCREAGVLFHTDAVQWAPHGPIRFDQAPIDLLTLTAHKLGGPRGIGALLRRPELPLGAQLGGGPQELGLRAGTEPVPLVAGFAAALQASVKGHQDGQVERIRAQRDRLLETLLRIPQLSLSGADPSPQTRLPHHISLVVRDVAGRPVPGRMLVRALWDRGIAASSGSACRSGGATLGPSPVLQALGHDAAAAAAGLRLSLGSDLSERQLARVPDALVEAIACCSSPSPQASA